MQRHERFSASFNTQLETMLEAFYPYILQKYKELPIETREANRSMAALLKVGRGRRRRHSRVAVICDPSFFCH